MTLFMAQSPPLSLQLACGSHVPFAGNFFQQARYRYFVARLTPGSTSPGPFWRAVMLFRYEAYRGLTEPCSEVIRRGLPSDDGATPWQPDTGATHRTVPLRRPHQ
jgi:hypothetical protein